MMSLYLIVSRVRISRMGEWLSESSVVKLSGVVYSSVVEYSSSILCVRAVWYVQVVCFESSGIVGQSCMVSRVCMVCPSRADKTSRVDYSRVSSKSSASGVSKTN